LIELIESGKSSEEIAVEIERTRQSVEQRARRLGLRVSWAERKK
jgi:DNA-binding NarL/FixJ family response regulator